MPKKGVFSRGEGSPEEGEEEGVPVEFTLHLRLRARSIYSEGRLEYKEARRID